MPQIRTLPSLEALDATFVLDAVNGHLIWRARTDRSAQWNGRFANKVAGGPRAADGRWLLNLEGSPTLVHRIIWKMHHRSEPGPNIDHRDTDRANNRPGNLRDATRHQNLQNSPKHLGKVLPKGVSRSPAKAERYRASIFVGGKQVHLGVFASPDGAHDAYRQAATQHFGEFARFE